VGDKMANVKSGNIKSAPQRWKHLKEFKRVFWKAERKAQNKAIATVVKESVNV